MLLIENNEVLLFREEPLVAVEDELGPSFFLILRSFALNSSILTAVHQDVLREWIIPILRRPAMFAEIYAMTDRSGSNAVNMKISASRLNAVQTAMTLLGASGEKVRHGFAKALGEDYFADRNRREPDAVVFKDNRKAGDFRSVVLALTPAPIGIPTKLFRNRTIANMVAFGRFHA